MVFRDLSFKAFLERTRSFRTCTFHEEKVPLFNSYFLIVIDCINNRLIDFGQSSFKIILKVLGLAEHTPFVYEKNCYIDSIPKVMDY
jgi:hypothetical protein